MDELLSDAKGFFESNKDKIGEVTKIGKKIIELDFLELAEHSTTLAENLIDRPEETIQLLEVALEELTWAPNDARVRFTNIEKGQELFIRHIRSRHLGKMISIEGIIRRASEIRPMATCAKFECPTCGTIISVLQIEKEFKEPTRCSCGRRGGFKEISQDMVDTQFIVLEENPEHIEDGGTQSKRINIFLSEDLTDPHMERRIIPGNKVKVIGILKEVKMKSGNKNLTRYDLVINANNVIPLEEDLNDVDISEEDEREIREISCRPDLIDYLSRSVAPSICGYMDVKTALVLQLFGGVKHKRSDGSMCREQIHGLLVGDPGTSKSVILKYLTSVAYKGRYVSGKSATGVGLTATAIFSEETKSWVLEAGAMVLANNGSLFIDEFEKMNKEDRSNLHEGMAMGTISVAKASVQATLMAKTSILAAANPKFGRFEEDRSMASQINLEPSLLSRFDFIFVMRDIPEQGRDIEIADKIIDEHGGEAVNDILDIDTFRKYIAYAKKLKPKMTKECTDRLKQYYVGLRHKSKTIGGKKVIPLGARQLEGLIRFSEASAKIKLQKEVTIENANEAIKIMETYLRQVGYDAEHNTFDIDKISGNSTSHRNKIDMVKSAIRGMENKYGKSVDIAVLKSNLADIDDDEIDDIIDKLSRSGETFQPSRGIIRLV